MDQVHQFAPEDVKAENLIISPCHRNLTLADFNAAKDGWRSQNSVSFRVVSRGCHGGFSVFMVVL